MWIFIHNYKSTHCHTINSKETVILCIQDTTELDFNSQETESLGRLSHDAGRGHPTLCIRPERTLLGISDAWMWYCGNTKKKFVK